MIPDKITKSYLVIFKSLKVLKNLCWGYFFFAIFILIRFKSIPVYSTFVLKISDRKPVAQPISTIFFSLL